MLINRHVTGRCIYLWIRWILLIALLINGNIAQAAPMQIAHFRAQERTLVEEPTRNAPPIPNDSIFLTTTGGGLDQYTYSGEVALYIPIARVFSTLPVEQAVANHILPSTVELSLSYYASEPPWCFPSHMLSINGHKLPIVFPRADGQWRKVSLDIPTTFLVDLPTKPGDADQKPATGFQTIIVSVDTAGCHCGVEIDWAAITINAPRPVLLNKSN